jgi:hypothetical protein
MQWQKSAEPLLDKTLRTVISGTLVEEQFKNDEGKEFIFLAWDEPQAEMRLSRDNPGHRNETLEMSLKKGAMFIYAVDGTLESVSEPSSEIDRAAIGIMSEILSFMQTSPLSKDPAWTVTEKDLHGSYSVNYSWLPHLKTLRKFNKSYVQDPRKTKSDVTDLLYSDDQSVVSDLLMEFQGFDLETGAYATAAGKQNTRVSVSNQMTLDSRSIFKIRRIRDSSSKPTSRMTLRHQQIDIKDFSRLSNKGQDIPVTFDEVLREVDKFADHRDIRDETAFVLKIRDLLRREPTKSSEVTALLEKYSPESDEYFAVLRGLLASQQPEAQKSLLQLINKNLELGRPHVLLVAHLAEFEQPVAELVSSLKRFTVSTDEELRSTALLAFGTVAAQINKYDEEKAHLLFLELKAKLNQTQNLSEKSTLWGALGNFGEQQTWELVQEQYANTDLALRHRLVNALRLVSGDGPMNFLLDKLLTGENESIRLASITALTFRRARESGIAVLGQALVKEPSLNVQSEILSYLSQNSKEFQSAQMHVEEFIRLFPNSEVTKAYLARKSSDASQ